MAKIQVHKAIIPNDYKLTLDTTTIQCDPATLPALPTFRSTSNDTISVAGSITKPGTTYVCDKYIIYNYSSTTISVNTSTYNINIPLYILSTNWTNNFRFVRFGICINGLNIKNEFDDIVNIRFDISLTFGGQITANSNAPIVETIKQGGTFNFDTYYYDFIYDTKRNTIRFEKKTI